MKTFSDEKSSLKTNHLLVQDETSQVPLAKPLRSLRPMKSMVKSSSLKPQRIQVGIKLRKQAIKA
jgi:hypothetical protein